MKPGFALDLRHETIRLLHRTDRGWLEVGQVAYDAPDITDQLAVLRRTALGLSPNGIATKLILPDSQILYIEAGASDSDPVGKQAQIGAALDGRTPYRLDELAFDWSETDGVVKVAAVARETLDEAEHFATTHKFNPVSFVASPETGVFSGEPYFGTTQAASELLSAGESIERDDRAVAIIGAVASGEVSAALTRARETLNDLLADQPDGEDDWESALVEAVQPTMPEPDKQNDPAGDLAGAPVSKDPALQETAPQDSEPNSGDESDDIEAPFIAIGDIPDFDEESTDDLPPLAFSSRRLSDESKEDFSGAFAPLSTPVRFTPSPGTKSAPASGEPDGAFAAHAQPSVTFGSVVDAGDTQASDASSGVESDPPRRKKQIRASVPEAEYGTAAQLRAASRARLPGVGQTDRMPAWSAGFGAMVDKPAPRTLLIGLVAVVLLVIAAALVWVVWPSAQSPGAIDSDAGSIGVAETQPVALPDEPVATAPGLPDGGPTDGSTGRQPAFVPPTEPADATGSQTATLDGTDPAIIEAIVTSLDDALSEDGLATQQDDPLNDGNVPALDIAPSGVANDGASISAGIASMPQPDAAGAPPVATLTAIGPDPVLPQPAADGGDPVPTAQPSPPPFGTTYQIGADGLVRPTPEGVVLPEGITLYAGSPPVVPKPRPGTLVPLLPAGDPVIGDTVTGDTVTGDTAEQSQTNTETDDLTLPPPVDPAHAALKPRPRPASVLAKAERLRAEAAAIAAAAEAAAEAMATASPQAVVTSRRPVARPDGLARSVSAAVASAVQEPAPVATVVPEADVDEPEPVSAVPNIPTTVTVARQATVKNAIRLGNMNLIGVYGSSANRRALIRLSSGRFVKVKIGDKLDGGKVAAIGDSTLNYVKNGKNYQLAIE